MRLFSAVIFWLLVLPIYSQADTLMVGLEGGTIIRASEEVRYRIPAVGKPYIQVDGEQKFPTDQVVYFQNEGGYFIKLKHAGQGRDRFLRRELEGKRISVYSKERNSPGYYVGGIYYADPTRQTWNYYQKDGSEVKSLNFANLKLDLADNPGSMQKLEEVKKIRFWHGMAILVGAGLLIAEFSQAPDPGDDFPILGTAGFAVIAATLFSSGGKKRRMWEAVQVYNK